MGNGLCRAQTINACCRGGGRFIQCLILSSCGGNDRMTEESYTHTHKENERERDGETEEKTGLISRNVWI